MELASSVADTREYFARTSALVVAFTVVLTVNFVGIMAIITGDATGTTGRFPWYVFLTAVVFVAVILAMEAAGADGRLVIQSAVTAAVIGFVLIVFGGEGIAYAVTNPDGIIDLRLLLYFLSAAVIATGVGYWGLRHWREFRSGGGF